MTFHADHLALHGVGIQSPAFPLGYVYVVPDSTMQSRLKQQARIGPRLHIAHGYALPPSYAWPLVQLVCFH